MFIRVEIRFPLRIIRSPLLATIDVKALRSFRYEEFSWPEIKELVKEDRVVILPTSTIEQHGPHLPLGVDEHIGQAVCQKTCAKIPNEVLLMPSVVYGYSPHHMDFPGSIGISAQNFVNYATDLSLSLAYHSFKRILIVNSHGSNQHLINQVARETMIQYPDVLCASVFCPPPTQRMIGVLEELREGGFGSYSHACEYETSLMLAEHRDLVKMKKASRDISYPKSDYTYYEFIDGPVTLYPYWSTLSRTGGMGDPTKATAAKGRRILQVAVEEMVKIVRDFRRRKIVSRVDHH